MRTRAVVGSAIASLAVLITGWIIGSASSSPAAPSTSTGTLTDGTYTGSAVQTRYGAVQVEITVSDGEITDVKALELTNADPRSEQISNEAAPLLRTEVLKAQSASVSTISGATYTTDGYLSSLQSALDKAKS